MGFLLHEEETRLPFRPAAASVDLDAFNRFDELLFIGLVDLHFVVACGALEHRRVKTGANTGDFGGHRINSDETANIVGTKLRNGPHLVTWKVDDADKGHQIAFPCIEEKLAQRLIRCSEMVVWVGQNVLSKFVVIALNLTVGNFQ